MFRNSFEHNGVSYLKRIEGRSGLLSFCVWHGSERPVRRLVAAVSECPISAIDPDWEEDTFGPDSLVLAEFVNPGLVWIPPFITKSYRYKNPSLARPFWMNTDAIQDVHACARAMGRVLILESNTANIRRLSSYEPIAA